MTVLLPQPGRCLVMGVLNVTPDSFSDGGCFADAASAIAHGLEMHAAGADYIDVGGESTRPGADRVDAEEECGRVLPVIRELTAAGVPTSVDTTRAEVAEAVSAKQPPSEKESGVTFRTPMTRHRPGRGSVVIGRGRDSSPRSAWPGCRGRCRARRR